MCPLAVTRTKSVNPNKIISKFFLSRPRTKNMLTLPRSLAVKLLLFVTKTNRRMSSRIRRLDIGKRKWLNQCSKSLRSKI